MKRATKSATKLVVLDNNDPISKETEQLQSRIRDRAYQLSQERGHAGREVDDWLTAESEIIAVPPAELIEKDGTFEVKLPSGPARIEVRKGYGYHTSIGEVEIAPGKAALRAEITDANLSTRLDFVVRMSYCR